MIRSEEQGQCYQSGNDSQIKLQNYQNKNNQQLHPLIKQILKRNNKNNNNDIEGKSKIIDLKNHFNINKNHHQVNPQNFKQLSLIQNQLSQQIQQEEDQQQQNYSKQIINRNNLKRSQQSQSQQQQQQQQSSYSVQYLNGKKKGKNTFCNHKQIKHSSNGLCIKCYSKFNNYKNKYNQITKSNLILSQFLNIFIKYFQPSQINKITFQKLLFQQGFSYEDYKHNSKKQNQSVQLQSINPQIINCKHKTRKHGYNGLCIKCTQKYQNVKKYLKRKQNRRLTLKQFIQTNQNNQQAYQKKYQQYDTIPQQNKLDLSKINIHQKYLQTNQLKIDPSKYRCEHTHIKYYALGYCIYCYTHLNQLRNGYFRNNYQKRYRKSKGKIQCGHDDKRYGGHGFCVNCYVYLRNHYGNNKTQWPSLQKIKQQNEKKIHKNDKKQNNLDYEYMDQIEKANNDDKRYKDSDQNNKCESIVNYMKKIIKQRGQSDKNNNNKMENKVNNKKNNNFYEIFEDS